MYDALLMVGITVGMGLLVVPIPLMHGKPRNEK